MAQKHMRIEDFDTSSNLHLCDSCCLDFPTCPGKILVWGDGVGNDNVVACASYEPLQVRHPHDIGHGRQPEIK